jgi:hypothetical protein
MFIIIIIIVIIIFTRPQRAAYAQNLNFVRTAKGGALCLQEVRRCLRTRTTSRVGQNIRGNVTSTQFILFLHIIV